MSLGDIKSFRKFLATGENLDNGGSASYQITDLGYLRQLENE
jgi:hypothetical protein